MESTEALLFISSIVVSLAVGMWLGGKLGKKLSTALENHFARKYNQD